MKLLTATSISQGEFPGDFSFASDGELVRLGEVCATDRRDPNGGCGCGRSFAGLVSRRATTTAVVTELDLSDHDLRAQVAAGLADAGYASAFVGRRAFTELVEETVDDMLHVANGWSVGTVVGRRLDRVHRRRPLPPGVEPENVLRALYGRP